MPSDEWVLRIHIEGEQTMTRMGTYWNPWREMNRLRQEMDHLVHHEWAPLARGTVGFPPVNLWENEKGLRVTAEIPGLDAAQLDVSLEKDVLTISGARAEVGSSNAEEDYVRRERWFEPFKRTIELPFEIDPDQCDATYEKGVLTVQLERRPEVQPKKLNIKAG
jgi:HSP20 family protein